MRVNVDWQEWQQYVGEAPQAASFALFMHEKQFDESDTPKTSHFQKAIWFNEGDFTQSEEGFPEARMELRLPVSGQEVDAALFSLAYARGTNHYRWVFRNQKLNDLDKLWEETDRAAQAAGNDPRLNNFGLYQITQPFGKAWGGYTVHTWLLPRVPAYFDCHMHIQSNHCAPLPLVWEKLPLGETFRMGWGKMDWLSAKLFKETGRIGAMSTEDIGKEALKQLKTAVWEGVVPYHYHYASMAKVLTPLPMDMDYGHFRGYQGEPIYRPDGDTFAYRRNPFSTEEHRISKKDRRKFEEYSAQLESHIKTNKEPNGAWSIFNYYHFDPRRHNGKNNWDYELKGIVSASQAGLRAYAGVKMYTSLGYRPLDSKLPVQHKLYAYCQAQGIPIMNHCTPSGMYTHEKRYFYDLLKHDANFETDSRIEDLEETMDAMLRSGSEGAALAVAGMAQEAEALKCLWFEERYVHPKAWVPVAKAYPGLRVCLAHFTGNDRWGNKHVRNGESKKGKAYGFKTQGDAIDTAKTSDWIIALFDLIRPENGFHADLSFFAVDKYSEEAFIDFLKWAKKSRPFLLDRILWGTDWPLLELGTELHAPLFNTFTENLLERLNRVDKTLWFRFSLINPARFLNLKGAASNWSQVVGGSVPAWVQQIPDNLNAFFELRPKKIT